MEAVEYLCSGSVGQTVQSSQACSSREEDHISVFALPALPNLSFLLHTWGEIAETVPLWRLLRDI